jgi:hypothetical protein
VVFTLSIFRISEGTSNKLSIHSIANESTHHLPYAQRSGKKRIMKTGNNVSREERERLQILMQCGVLDSEINEADYTSITSAATKLLKVS